MTQKPSHYIKRIAATPKMNEKKAILREAATDGCVELFEGFKLAYDRTISFSVKKIPIIKGDFTDNELVEDIGEFGWKNFAKLANELSTNKLSGKPARGKLRSIASIVCIEDWNLFYRAILTKDMKCGITEVTINKILNEIGDQALQYTIPVWKIHLSSEAKDFPEKLIGEKAIESSYEATRVLAIMDIESQTVTMIGSTGNELKKYQTIVDSLVQLLSVLPFSMIFDGEVLDDDARYEIFDMLLLGDFKSGGTDMTLMARHSGLIELAPYLQEVSDGLINIVPKKIINLDTNIEELKSLYDEAIATGHKSIMIKDPQSPYICEQNTFWLRWTP